MDVLIVERDELVGSMLADTLTEEGISAAVAPDDQALALPQSAAPRIVITGINRGHNEDLTGLGVVSALLCKWPQTVRYLPGRAVAGASAPSRPCANSDVSRPPVPI